MVSGPRSAMTGPSLPRLAVTSTMLSVDLSARTHRSGCRCNNRLRIEAAIGKLNHRLALNIQERLSPETLLLYDHIMSVAQHFSHYDSVVRTSNHGRVQAKPVTQPVESEWLAQRRRRRDLSNLVSGSCRTGRSHWGNRKQGSIAAALIPTPLEFGIQVGDPLLGFAVAVHGGHSCPQNIARHSRELLVVVRLLARAVWVDLVIPCQINTAVAHVYVPLAIVLVTCNEAASVHISLKATRAPLTDLPALVFVKAASLLHVANVRWIASKAATASGCGA